MIADLIKQIRNAGERYACGRGSLGREHACRKEGVEAVFVVQFIHRFCETCASRFGFERGKET